MPTTQLLLYAVYALAAAAVILVIEAVYVSASRSRSRSGTINRRLKRLVDEAPAEEVLSNLLRERGLTGSGDFSSGMIGINRLYTQSGITRRPSVFFATFLISAIAAAAALRILGFAPVFSVIAFVAISVVLPWFRLRRARNRRIQMFERQLPDTLDMIVRSLRAGHPTNVAVSMVAREMPDPIGTEFGIMSDEITFGQSLEQATRKLAERVGYEGVHLLAVSLSIQAKTGGNLTEILQNLSKVLRERAKLRLKIRALASEGRASALLISLFPVFMFGILLLIAPTYYGDIWDNPLVVPVFVVFGFWALLGDYIMYRMVNFDF